MFFVGTGICVCVSMCGCVCVCVCGCVCAGVCVHISVYGCVWEGRACIHEHPPFSEHNAFFWYAMGSAQKHSTSCQEKVVVCVKVMAGRECSNCGRRGCAPADGATINTGGCTGACLRWAVRLVQHCLSLSKFSKCNPWEHWTVLCPLLTYHLPQSIFVSVYRRLLSVCSCCGEELLYGSYPFCSSQS